jgi:hypothetical protein
MKMKPEDYAALKAAVIRKVETHDREKIKAHRETLKKDQRVKDLEMRYRWDIMNLKTHYAENNALFDIFYRYLNDNHIDTALKRVIKELDL